MKRLHCDEVAEYHARALHEVMVPIFNVNQIVYYWCGKYKHYWVGVVRSVLIPDAQDRMVGLKIRYAVEPEGEDLRVSEPNIIVCEYDIRPIEWAIGKLSYKKPTRTTCLPIGDSTPLLSLGCVGIDTCSALSVSTQRDDFSFIDESPQAMEPVSLRGIGGV
jgi:hypothetical protein